MTVDEILSDFTNRIRTARVIVTVVEPSSCKIFTIKSIAGGNERAVVLNGEPIESPLEGFAETLLHAGTNKVFKASIQTDEKTGKYRVSVDGAVMQSGIETEPEAKQFLGGFVLGYESGSGAKGGWSSL